MKQVIGALSGRVSAVIRTIQMEIFILDYTLTLCFWQVI